jgi:hypothetical protein
LSKVDLVPEIGEIRRGRDIGKSLSQHPSFFRYQACISCGKKWWARANANVKKCRNCCCRKERLYSTKDPVVGEIRYGEEIGKIGSEHNVKFIYIECSWCGVRWWTDVYRIPTKCAKCAIKKPRKRDCGKPMMGDIRWGDEIGEGFRAGARYEYRKCEDCGMEWWAGLNNSNPKCLKKCFVCVHREPRKYSKNKPRTGEVRWGDEIGRMGDVKKQFIWSDCELCGKERWVGCRKGMAVNKRCTKCGMVGHDCKKSIETRIRNIKATKEKVCRRCKNKYPATVEYFKSMPRSILGIGALCISCAKQRMSEFNKKKNQFIGERLSSGIRQAINDGLNGKKNRRHWETLVGYTLENLMKHLEKQFTEGMSWDNYGKRGWHLDHILPRACFYFTEVTDLDFKRCWALTNLQPLWWRDNIIKNAKITKPFQPSLELCFKDSFRNKMIRAMVIKDLPSVYRCDIVN